MNGNYESYPQPEIKLPSNAIEGDQGDYWVELGDQRFSKHQWELIQLYAEGSRRAKMRDHDVEVTRLANAIMTHVPGEPSQSEGALATATRLILSGKFMASASMQEMVKAFHEGMGQPVGLAPHPLPQHRVAVRVELIREEFIDELIPALEAGDLVDTVDAAIDILYVVFGLLVEMGVLAYPLFAEVQRSNMSKFGEDGKAIIAGPNDPDGIFEGRVKKGPNYFKPNLHAILMSGDADLDQGFYEAGGL